jgi:DNA-binding CsgD family transcriptional regulator
MIGQDLKIEIRFKNNLLLSKIFESYLSVTDFARKNNLSKQTIGSFINFKKKPVVSKKFKGAVPCKLWPGHFFIKPAIDIAAALECSVLEIFPETFWLINESKFVKYENIENMIPYSENELLPVIDSPHIEIDPIDFDNVLATIDPRQEKVIRLRFFEGKTLDETGVILGVSRERVRQIECKSLRKLRHPVRSEKLRKYLTN